MKLPVMYSELTSHQRRKVREEYIKRQEGKCMFCQNDLDGDPTEEVMRAPIILSLFPPNFLKWPIHLQHNHDTDLTEGAVHARCNAVMWQYYDR